YGPATFADFAYWTQGSIIKAKRAWQQVLPELTEVEVKDQNTPHYIYGETNWHTTKRSPVRLLPKFDPLVMGHKDKSLFLDANLKDRVFRKAGQVEATVLADLKLRGTWRTIRKGKVLRFEIEPF